MTWLAVLVASPQRVGRWAVALGVAGLLAVAWSEAARADEVVDMYESLRFGAEGMRPLVQSLALRTAATLVAVEFLVTVFFLYIRGTTAAQMLTGLFYKAGLLLFMVPLVTNSAELLTPGFNFIVGAGTAVTGITPQPYGIISAGAQLFFETMTVSFLDLFDFTLFPRLLVTFIVALWLLVAAVITGTLVLVALIEGAIVIYGGALFLAFGVSRFTATLADNYFAYAMGVAIKIYFLTVVLSLAQGQSAEWVETIRAMDSFEDITDAVEIAAAAMVFALTAAYVPATAASRITAGFAIGFQRAHQNAGY
jgi:type IV secretion system protein TrbL